MFKPKFLGYRLNFTVNFVGHACAGVKRFHFAVRDDVFEALEEDFAHYTNDTGLPQSIDPVHLPRPKDVAHFWDPNVAKRAVLRSLVSQHLKRMEQTYPD